MMADGWSMFNLLVHGQKPPTYLIASAESEDLARVEALLVGTGAVVDFARSSNAVLERVGNSNPPDLLLLDANLPGMNMEQLVAAIGAESNRLPVVLIADAVTEQLRDWLRAEVIADLILRNSAAGYWELRSERAFQMRWLESELELLRETAMRDAQHDRLTGLLNREAQLAALLRETDRAQRSNSTLTLVLFDIDDFGHWNSRLGMRTCDELLCQVATRIARMLRSYDLLGRTGKDEFLLGLPGCSAMNATMLAERLKVEVFAAPYHVGGDAVRLSACFGIAQSMGRSPVVVLREAEQALARAREAGPESIEYGASVDPAPQPVTFLLPTSGEELLAW
jgi:two-component system, cell cycle response regulator